MIMSRLSEFPVNTPQHTNTHPRLQERVGEYPDVTFSLFSRISSLFFPKSDTDKSTQYSWTSFWMSYFHLFLSILFSLILSLFSPVSVLLSLLSHARLACLLSFRQGPFPASFHGIWRAVVEVRDSGVLSTLFQTFVVVIVIVIVIIIAIVIIIIIVIVPREQSLSCSIPFRVHFRVLSRRQRWNLLNKVQEMGPRQALLLAVRLIWCGYFDMTIYLNIFIVFCHFQNQEQEMRGGIIIIVHDSLLQVFFLISAGPISIEKVKDCFVSRHLSARAWDLLHFPSGVVGVREKLTVCWAC